MAKRIRQKNKVWFFAVIFLILILGLIFGIGAWIRGNDIGNATDMMKLTIWLSDGITLDDINAGDKSEVYEGNELTLVDGDGTKTYRGVQLKGRGNSTWAVEKKPYQIELQRRADPFNLGRGRKWILLADYFDETHLRNDTAFYLEEMLGEEFPVRGTYAEVFIDETELGLYFVTNKVEISKNSVDLRDPLGILVEVDNLHGSSAECYRTSESICLVVEDTVDPEMEKEAIRDFLKDFDRLEVVAKSGDYKTVREVIDVESFAKYYLLSEFTVNPDAYTSSWFLYKDGPNDKIHAGPGWDFDLALGNRRWVWTDNENFYSPEETMVRRIEAMRNDDKRDVNTTRVMYYLMDMPEFRAEVERIYTERLSGRFDELKRHIITTAAEIAPAAEADNARWGRGNFYENVDYLLDWLSRRYRHFEAEYGGEAKNDAKTRML
ncbi:CotH kinase family protein [Candidatus Saccharibacteria bacterium]|nr:CotH kinase family protein [Candidatus Saccharibacteria bacterium]